MLQVLRYFSGIGVNFDKTYAVIKQSEVESELPVAVAGIMVKLPPPPPSHVH